MYHVDCSEIVKNRETVNKYPNTCTCFDAIFLSIYTYFTWAIPLIFHETINFSLICKYCSN